jgi:nicotinamide phosphoribosyltransferase
MNPIFSIDAYKLDHRRQYPKGTTKVYSNWTPRSARLPGAGDGKEVVFFGLQYMLDRLDEDMHNHFFAQPLEKVLLEYQNLLNSVFGPNDIGTDHIRALWHLGHLPLEFRAVPEGTLVPLRVPMLTVENTHPDFFWLVNYFETYISAALWRACTSATTAWRYRDLLNKAAERTGGDPHFVPWQGHDFSFRGLDLDSAPVSAAGHLLSFTGTDTIPVIQWINKYYPGVDNGLLGGSVPATEHSVMCAGGEEGEWETFDRLLALYPSGVLSVVSDTWDLWRVLTEYLPSRRAQIMGRNGKLVIRPDSGDPVKIICGDYDAPLGSPAFYGVIDLLYREFGGTKNSKGFVELDPHIGAIYGDSITVERAKEITEQLQAKGFASTNIVLGIGSYTYQYVTRDTYGFAMKATWCEIDGVGHDIFKKPKTDDGAKNSAKGRLAVFETVGGLQLVEQATDKQINEQSLLTPGYRNGRLLRYDTFADIRARLWPIND